MNKVFVGFSENLGDSSLRQMQEYEFAVSKLVSGDRDDYAFWSDCDYSLAGLS